MEIRWILKVLFGLVAVLCSVVVGIMYTKLSFVDWPYVIGGLILFGVAFLIPRKKKKIKTE